MKSLTSRVLRALGDTVYLSIDLDALDPSIMPGVGNPVPWGMGWYEILERLRVVIERKKIVAADIMELCPVPVEVVSEFTAARLLYRLMGYLSLSRSRGRKKK